MITAPEAVVQLLQNSPEKGHGERKLVWFSLADTGGAPVTRGFWTGSEDHSFTVIGGVSGLEETRDYYGNALISVSDITCSAEMTVPSVAIDLSQIADVAQQLIREYNARLARVEVHTLYLDPETAMPVGTLLDWVGEIDKAPIKEPKLGGEGSVAVTTVSDIMSMLTRVSGRKSSYEDAKKYAGGDEIGIYGSTAGSWDIPWGQKKTT